MMSHQCLTLINSESIYQRISTNVQCPIYCFQCFNFHFKLLVHSDLIMFVDKRFEKTNKKTRKEKIASKKKRPSKCYRSECLSLSICHECMSLIKKKNPFQHEAIRYTHLRYRVNECADNFGVVYIVRFFLFLHW